MFWKTRPRAVLFLSVTGLLGCGIKYHAIEGCMYHKGQCYYSILTTHMQDSIMIRIVLYNQASCQAGGHLVLKCSTCLRTTEKLLWTSWQCWILICDTLGVREYTSVKKKNVQGLSLCTLSLLLKICYSKGNATVLTFWKWTNKQTN